LKRTRVEPIERDPELAQRGEELRLHEAMNDVVDALVHHGLHIPVLPADPNNLCDFPPVGS
jgi:hypothetical protein